MKILLLITFLLAPIAGLAQPSCLPKQAGGTGSIAIVKADAVGMSYGWLCGRAINQFWGTWDKFIPDWQGEAARIVAGGKPAVDAAFAKYTAPVGRGPNGEALFPAELSGVVPPVWQALFAMLPPAPISGLVVAPTSICAAADKDASGRCVRRSAYAWASGVRGAVNGTATIGAACDQSIGAAGFYGVNGRPDQVAPCVKQ